MDSVRSRVQRRMLLGPVESVYWTFVSIAICRIAVSSIRCIFHFPAMLTICPLALRYHTTHRLHRHHRPTNRNSAHRSGK